MKQIPELRKSHMHNSQRLNDLGKGLKKKMTPEHKFRKKIYTKNIKKFPYQERLAKIAELPGPASPIASRNFRRKFLD